MATRSKKIKKVSLARTGTNWVACHQSRLSLACGRGVRRWLYRRPSTYGGRLYQPDCCCLKVGKCIQKPQGGWWRTIFQCKSHVGEVKLLDTDGPWCYSTHNAPRLWTRLAIKRWDGNFPRDRLRHFYGQVIHWPVSSRSEETLVGLIYWRSYKGMGDYRGSLYFNDLNDACYGWKPQFGVQRKQSNNANT